MPRKRCISFLYSFGHEENQDEEDIGNDDGSSFNREHDIASRLKDDRMPVCSEMELRFHMKEERYAITAVRIYDQNHEVVDQRSREAEYRKIPVNSFVSTMYQVAKKYILFQKTKAK